MRRLWAHIILAVSALAVMAVTFTSVVSKTTRNMEYEQGRELVFRVSEKDETPDDGLTPAENIVKVMEERLSTAKVSQYDIQVVGEDTIKLKTRQQSEEQYNYLQLYLTFNGSLALTGNVDGMYLTADEFINGKVTLETYNGYPSIVIPVDNSDGSRFETFVAWVKDNCTEVTKDHDHEEGESEEEEEKALYMYMWYDFDENYDSYAKADPNNEDEYDENVAAKLLQMNFDVLNDNMYYPDGEKDKLGAMIGISASNGSTVTTSDISIAYQRATFYVNLLNAGELDYKVTLINSSQVMYVDPSVDTLFNFNSTMTLAFNKTLCATLCAILVVTLLLIVFYRLGALSIGTVTLSSVFGALGFVVLIGAEFNTAAIIGLILVAISSLASGVVYLTKLHEEAYRGRTLKKANSEASKKSLLPIVDINAVTVIIGIFVYIFGGSAMRSFAFISVIGGLISLILNLLALRGLMWLATNATGLTGKYEVFNIDPSKVPNHMLEEKQTYFGPFENKDFTKKKKPVAILASILFVATVGGMITFGAINNGAIFNNKPVTENSELYFESTDESLTSSKVGEILEDILVYTDDEANANALSTYVKDTGSDIINYSYEQKKENTGEEDYHYESETHYVVVVTLSSKVDFAQMNAKSSKYTSIAATDFDSFMEAYLGGEGLGLYDGTTASCKKVVTQVVETVKYDGVMLGAFIATCVSALYLILRYRLSRGLTSILLPVVTSAIAIGAFSLVRTAVSPYLIVALPLIAACSLIMSIIFMNKERELVLDDKTRDNSVENREKIMVRANSLAYQPILVFTIIVAFIGVNFFGFGPASNATIFALLTVGVLLSALLVTTLYGPISQLLYKAFSNVHIDVKPRKNNKKKTQKKHKSAEPEEAIFIGIND